MLIEELKEEERKGGNKEKSKERKFQCQSLYTKDSSVEQWGLSTVLTLIKIVNNEKSCCALGSEFLSGLRITTRALKHFMIVTNRIKSQELKE